MCGFRALGHGLTDRLTDTLAAIKAEGSIEAASSAIDIAWVWALKCASWACRWAAPAARSVATVKNDNDEAIDNTTLDDQVQLWRSTGATNLETFNFGVEQRLVHDLIDPDQPAQHIDDVYSILIDLLEK